MLDQGLGFWSKVAETKKNNILKFLAFYALILVRVKNQ